MDEGDIDEQALSLNHGSALTGNVAKELIVALINEVEISYEGVERLLSAVIDNKFNSFDVRFRVQDIDLYAVSTLAGS